MRAKHVALWGYGDYGKIMRRLLTREKTGKYEVTVIFDQRFELLNKNRQADVLIQDPALAKQLYDEGKFDELLVTVYDGAQRTKITAMLEEIGVPVWNVKEVTPMEPAEYFPTYEAPRPMTEKGYTYYSFKDQYLEILKNGRHFIFDKEGMLNGAYWHSYQRYFDYSTQLFYADFSGPILELTGEYCLLCGNFGTNYWHFTFESLDHLYVMEQSGYQGKYLVFHTSFAEELLRLTGLDLSRVLWMDDLTMDTVYHFEKLVCPMVPDDSYKYAAPVLMKVAELIRRNLPPMTHPYPEKIYVKRIGSRKLIIDPKVVAAYGFETIVPEELSVSEQIRYFQQAKVILSPHGANSTNSLYMQPGSVLIETFPNSYINPTCLDTLVLQKDVYYLPVTQRLEPSMPKNTDPYADYSIDPNLLELTIRAAERLSR